MLRHPMFAILGVWLVLLSACGREINHKMTETEAFNEISDAGTQGGDDLINLLQELSDNGQLTDGNRTAIASATDLSTLSSLLGLLNSGNVSNLTQLANGMVAQNSGSTTATSSKLDGLMKILQMALPIVSIIAPQFAPILTALVTIVPLVIQVIGMFKKPSASLLLTGPSFA